ncbi:D-sedoheptulose 7-phosphate isomerase [Terriglobus sp.]|uniref:D-sedoheptulose 7-phosphate isomerase n=1 Tax=Terriglobus sp. TaxID=1889013 RepID=UPI003B00FD3A
MNELVRQQLRMGIATLQRTLADDALVDSVARAAEATAEAMQRGNKLMIAGNGGSAADAQHLSAEFVARLTVDRPALRCIALTTDSSAMTAIGNDYAFDRLFSRQIEAIGTRGDLFLGISTSGNSPNILKALELSRDMGITTVGFSGNRGGKMADLCDYNIIVPSETTMHIQESHIALEHIFCMIVERCYFGPTFGQ